MSFKVKISENNRIIDKIKFDTEKEYNDLTNILKRKIFGDKK